MVLRRLLVARLSCVVHHQHQAALRSSNLWHRITGWIEDFRVQLGLEIEADQWLRYCDFMGLQRNFKIVGIFARLHYRDGKNGYLEMIPQFYEYLTSTLRNYPEFSELLKIMEQAECAP